MLFGYGRPACSWCHSAVTMQQRKIDDVDLRQTDALSKAGTGVRDRKCGSWEKLEAGRPDAVLWPAALESRTSGRTTRSLSAEGRKGQYIIT